MKISPVGIATKHEDKRTDGRMN